MSDTVFEDVMKALYDLSDKGGKSIGPEPLEGRGFASDVILDAMNEGVAREYVREINSGTDGLGWLLTPKGCYYVEGLIRRDK